MGLQRGYDLVAFHGTNFAQLTTAGNSRAIRAEPTVSAPAFSMRASPSTSGSASRRSFCVQRECRLVAISRAASARRHGNRTPPGTASVSESDVKLRSRADPYADTPGPRIGGKIRSLGQVLSGAGSSSAVRWLLSRAGLTCLGRCWCERDLSTGPIFSKRCGTDLPRCTRQMHAAHAGQESGGPSKLHSRTRVLRGNDNTSFIMRTNGNGRKCFGGKMKG